MGENNKTQHWGGGTQYPLIMETHEKCICTHGGGGIYLHTHTHTPTPTHTPTHIYSLM